MRPLDHFASETWLTAIGAALAPDEAPLAATAAFIAVLDEGREFWGRAMVAAMVAKDRCLAAADAVTEAAPVVESSQTADEGRSTVGNGNILEAGDRWSRYI